MRSWSTASSRSPSRPAGACSRGGSCRRVEAVLRSRHASAHVSTSTRSSPPPLLPQSAGPHKPFPAPLRRVHRCRALRTRPKSRKRSTFAGHGGRLGRRRSRRPTFARCRARSAIRSARSRRCQASSPLASGLPYFYIRGAPPNDNGYYVDGIRVPLLFHVGIGQRASSTRRSSITSTSIRVPHRPATEDSQARPSRVRRASRRPRRTVKPTSASSTPGRCVEAPLDDGRGSVLAAGRYGYPGPILSAITSNVKLDYWDYQTRATLARRRSRHAGRLRLRQPRLPRDATVERERSERTRAGARTAAEHSLQELLVSDFHRLDLRWDHVFANGDGHMRVAATVGYDSQGAAPTYATDYSAAIAARD